MTLLYFMFVVYTHFSDKNENMAEIFAKRRSGWLESAWVEGGKEFQ